MSAMDPLDFFKAESGHADAIVRTEAMARTVLVAAILGADRARDELVPYLLTRVTDLDQVTLALSSNLGGIVPFIGGPDNVTCLIPLLEQLCGIEETTVRVALAGSIAKILLTLSPASNYKAQAIEFFDLFTKLSSPEEEGVSEIFCSRVTAAYIIPEIYHVLPDEIKPQALELYANKVLTDEMSIVKRAAANSFIKTVRYCTDARAKSNEFLAMMKSILNDEVASVKIIGIENLSTYATILKENGSADVLSTDILPLVKAATEDASWMVRKTISQRYGLFAKCFSKEEVTETVFPGLMLLVQDQEPDVRSLALKEMLAFLDVVGHSTYLDVFVPVAVQLADDPIADARKILTLLLIDIASRVKAEAVAQHLSDLILRLTVDEDPMVRLRVLQKLDIIGQETPSLCTRLTEPLKGMLSDLNWRVRKQAALAAPGVMKSMGKEYLQSHFLAGLLELLHDGVDEVRTAVSSSLPKIAALGGSEWAYETIFPAIRSMATSEFLVRLSMLTALQGLIESDLQGTFQSEALALLVATTNDKVPNIRLRAAQVLGKVCAALGPETSRVSIRPVLAALQGDKDRDVVYFANESLKKCA